MSTEKIFANGFIFKRSEKAPEFVVGEISIKVADAIEFLNANDKKGWVNLKVNKARGGNYYIELNTYEPKQQTNSNNVNAEDDLPF